MVKLFLFRFVLLLFSLTFSFATFAVPDQATVTRALQDNPYIQMPPHSLHCAIRITRDDTYFDAPLLQRTIKQFAETNAFQQCSTPSNTHKSLFLTPDVLYQNQQFKLWTWGGHTINLTAHVTNCSIQSFTFLTNELAKALNDSFPGRVKINPTNWWTLPTEELTAMMRYELQSYKYDILKVPRSVPRCLIQILDPPSSSSYWLMQKTVEHFALTNSFQEQPVVRYSVYSGPGYTASLYTNDQFLIWTWNHYPSDVFYVTPQTTNYSLQAFASLTNSLVKTLQATFTNQVIVNPPNLEPIRNYHISTK